MEANSKSGRALPTGMALAATVGIGYTACAVVFRLWPEAALVFMNSLFHGLDFRRLQATPAPFEFGGFFFALAGIVIWAFLMGALLGWIVDRLRPAHAIRQSGELQFHHGAMPAELERRVQGRQ